MNKQNPTLIDTVPAAKELRNVPGFDPMKFVRRTAAKTGETALKLDLPYKRLWFRLACPDGRMLLNPLRLTDQMAIFEARLYASRDDASLISSFTSTQLAQDGPGVQYIRDAQDEALNTALDNAGFGIQLCDMPQLTGSGEAAPDTPQEQPSPEPPVETAPIAPKVQPPAEPASQPKAASVPPVQKAAPQAAPKVISMPAHEQPPAPAAEPAAAVEVPPQSVSETPATEVLPAEKAAQVPRFTADMTVEEIRALMTLDEAKAIIVPLGSCAGLTLGRVAEERRASLKWYLYAKTDNIVKAGATMLMEELGMKKAG